MDKNLKPKTRVLVRTLPLENGNYGGVLQAYALQQVLEELGFSATTDRATRYELASFSYRAKAAVKRILLLVGYRNDAWLDRIVRDADSATVTDFVDRRIRTAELFSAPGVVNKSTLDNTDAFVVGSDQVWRAAYADVSTNFFGFLNATDSRKRVSYAASFGRDNLAEYSDDEKLAAGRLAKNFSAVSVRERAGRDLVQSEWKVPACHHVDPTMLLTPDHYGKLAANADVPISSEGVVDYVLDRSPSVERAIATISRVAKQPAHSLLPPAPATLAKFTRRRAKFARPAVESWLGAIANAAFVVTDSFHGTVFSILNNTPFIAVVNEARGASRFESLVEMFGLERRLLRTDEELDPTRAAEPIDWASVNQRLSEERARSRAFLLEALTSSTSI